MLGCGVWRGVGSRNVCGNGSVVDDAAALRRLVLHHPKRSLCAKKNAVQIDCDNGLPLYECQVFKRDSRTADSGIVKEHVDSSEGFLSFCEERGNGSSIADIGRNCQRGDTVPGIGQCLVQNFCPPSGKDDGISVSEKCERRAASDSR